MPFTLQRLRITLNGTGTEIPALDVSDTYSKYDLVGTATATGNYAIVATGTPVYGTTYSFKYSATLDITTNSTTFTLFGTAITQAQLLKNWYADCVYNGSTWEVTLLMDFSETEIISTANLADLSVTTAKLNTVAVTNPKIANNTINLHAKSVALSLTGAEIANNTIDGYTKLQAASVTDDRLALMPNNYFLGNISGGLHSPSGIPISTFDSFYWALTGNAGTTAGTNFLGTTDPIDLVFKVNNDEAGRLSFGGNSNTSLGRGALISYTSGSGTSNTAIGVGSLTNLTTGQLNTGVGADSLNVNINGNHNTAIGRRALFNVTSGADNVALGYNSCDSVLSTGSYNTMLGDNTEVDSSSALHRIAIGYGATATQDFQLMTPSGLSSAVFTNANITAKGLVITNKSQNISAGNSATINATTGSFRKSSSGTTFVLSNNLISSTSIVILQMATAGITTGYDMAVSTAYGSATIYFQSAGVLAAPSSICDINFWVIN